MGKQDVFGLVSLEDFALFNSEYEEIVKNFIKQRTDDEPRESRVVIANYLKKLVDYTAPTGKKIRGLLALATFKSLVENPSREQLRAACVVGWCNEIMEAAYLVADDIMDRSTTRRGQTCWHLLPEIGLSAVNDGFLLTHVAYDILKQNMGGSPYYTELVENFHEFVLTTVIGQLLDGQTENTQEDISKTFTQERYDTIVKLKSSYYSLYQPVLQGFILAGEGKPLKIMKTLEHLALAFGHWFTVENDFNDCFNEDKGGKVGTDIEENKCSWLVVTAISKCDKGQLEILKENYGKADPEAVKVVKSLYSDLNMVKEYKNYSEIAGRTIHQLLDELPASYKNLRKIYESLVAYLNKTVM